jgi:hypothetical protein
VGRQDHGGSPVKQVPDRRQGGLDAGVVGNLPISHGHVEVDPDKVALAGHVRVGDGTLRHDAVCSWISD